METAIRQGRVLILDDDVSVGRAYARTLGDEGYEAMQFSRFQDLKDFVAGEGDTSVPLCLLLDMRMPDVSGLAVQQWIKDEQRAIPVIFISGQSQISEAITAMRNGAVDFLLKPIEEDRLISAVDGVMNAHRIAGLEGALPPGFESLTPRESQVLMMVVQGMRSQQIADRLGITLRTIKMHRGNIMTKVGVDNVAQLVALYQERRYEKQLKAS